MPERAGDIGSDREPQPSDGPDYHAEHAAWVERRRLAVERFDIEYERKRQEAVERGEF